jgi:anti-sigma-K factor RskA
MNFKNKPELQQKLAAEYVLGTLRGAARRRFESWMQQDPSLHNVVRQWQGNLVPMAEFSTAVKPAPAVWQSLEKRLKIGNQQGQAFWQKLRDSINFWRGLGLVSSTAALVMVSVLLIQQLEKSVPVHQYVATLSDDKSQAIAVISGDDKHRQLVVRMVAGQQIAADKSLELWAVSKEGTVRSLGLMASNGIITLRMPDNMTPETTPVLAVTLEPKGGSGNPTKPSGPIIFKGSWVQLG